MKLLTQSEFDAHVAAKTLRIAFIGMSNVGKSHRSSVLKSGCGFSTYSVDDDIMKELKLLTMGSMAAWMGLPFDAKYKNREEKYLALEDRYTRTVAQSVSGTNVVFDTTGSVIYVSRKTQHILSEQSLIVHIEASEKVVASALETFFDEPKPVVWGQHFNQKEGEIGFDALRRCYPALLHFRLEAYRALAHVNIPFAELKDGTGPETLASIKKLLPR